MMSLGPYDPHLVENKWQRYWLDRRLFSCEVNQDKPKSYVLDMFPYPSGSGLHVGHLVGYVATDVISRFRRMQGFNVLHPMGWDSFGLPAEQYAMRTGTHPSITTQRNIDVFRKQLQEIGLSYDWDREFATSDPDYYRWTQWIFTKLYERGLAYEAEAMVNYCPALGTVLANEEVVDGLSVVGGHPVERRPLKQWMLRITAYADRLIADLEDLDWPDSLKKLQTNWIGRSEGAEIDFAIEGNRGQLKVYTTCPHTVMGVTFITLAPEHALVKSLIGAGQEENVASYLQRCETAGEQDRMDPSREKTGVFTGTYAVHPVTGALIPIWIGDYVLGSVGSGAVMGVPAHDTRDFAFARRYNLPIVCVVDPSLDLLEAEGVMDPAQARERILAGLDCWPGEGTIMASDYHDLCIDGLTTDEAKKVIVDWLISHGHGRSAVHYKLRDWLFSRQRYWGEPFPILHIEGGGHRVLELDELPLIPPHLTDFKPVDGELSPLASAKHWVFITDPKTGKPARREINTMPQWAGSCWYYLRFCDPTNTQAAWSQEAEKYWMPVDLYVGGAEHAVLHLLYARFWHKVLYDCGLVHTDEPFAKYRYQGLVLGRSYRTADGRYLEHTEVEEQDGEFFEKGSRTLVQSQIEKMSKSKLNGVSPDEVMEEYGADATRLYALFIGPFDKEKIWNTDNITGCRRFLNRLWELCKSDKVVDEDHRDSLACVHRLIRDIEHDISNMQFNTAVAKLMEALNQLQSYAKLSKQALGLYLHVLSPMAPHIAEELWQRLGNEQPLASASWPRYDEALCVEDQVELIVQVNGRLRAALHCRKGLNEAEVIQLARSDAGVVRHLILEPRKIVFVPDRLINFVV